MPLNKPTLEEELEMLENEPENWKKMHIANLKAQLKDADRNKKLTKGSEYRYKAVIELTEEDWWVDMRKKFIKRALEIKESETSGSEQS